ncbi:poly(A) RNA polymerase cid14 [Phlyctema vagabunda]|uniref:polynucleotide adenylyltransferase n=1 Tax=Phlyctema vagabunda TaxID=108571 RepID=A0ABR4PMG0_9HELO
MDISEDDDNASGSEQPKKKMARTGQKAADGDSVPKWSNPDPYTALPPPDESLRKKKDVVKLIRKARVEGGSAAKTEEAAEDFISFDFGGDEDEDKDDESDAGNLGVPGAPTGPRYSHRDNIHKVDSRPPPHPEPELTLPVVPGKRAASPIDLTSDPALGNRKRTFNDEIKAPPLIHKANKGKKNPPASGKILPEWRSRSDASATPWIKLDHSNTANMGVWLHKEIMDFYHHVKPREFEQAIRTKVVDDLRAKVREEFYGAEIQCFGSFMAGLYLPTADMDLVCLSRSFLQGRHGQLADRSALYKFKAFLDRSNLVMPGSVELIPKAKVPLVKYVDRVTGLKIDISFENDTGVIANKTFQDWKTEFPSMPILVTVIKHFLAMRGLNEPVNGGIGGFSVTCLVVSLLQHMPQVQSRNMIPEHHLGEVLMEFFDLYGNLFNYQTTAIQMNPPALIRRESNTGAIYRNTNQVKFSIIDPNRSSNDIAGGSSNAAVIIKEFSKAFQLLQARMGHLQNAKDRKHESILGCLLAGDYTTFDLQREHLAHIHEHLIGPIDDRTII